MEFQEVVKNRYSCKKYSDRQVEKEKIDAILEAGRLAPTAKNLQEQHVYVLQSQEALAKASDQEGVNDEEAFFCNILWNHILLG